MFASWVRFALALACASACGSEVVVSEVDEPEPDRDPIVRVDAGAVCVTSTEDQVIIDFSQCMDGECLDVVDAVCTAAVLGDRINVHSEVRVKARSDSCQFSDGCEMARARCTVDVDRREYLMHYAGQQAYLPIPTPDGWVLGPQFVDGCSDAGAVEGTSFESAADGGS